MPVFNNGRYDRRVSGSIYFLDTRLRTDVFHTSDSMHIDVWTVGREMDNCLLRAWRESEQDSMVMLAVELGREERIALAHFLMPPRGVHDA